MERYPLSHKEENCGETDARYYLAPKLQNCKPGKIIDSIEECEKASNDLDLTYGTAVTEVILPAGCHRIGSRLTQFNTILNPDETIPSAFDDNVAICRCLGTFNQQY